MRIKILLLGDDPVSLLADGQLLRERGLMVFPTFNLQNITELIEEVKPDALFFDPRNGNNQINEVYNGIINNGNFNNLPVIFTLSEDDIYLVTRKRADTKEKKNIIADNIISALKMALHSNRTYHKKTHVLPHRNIDISNVIARA